jgi:hypothetical protein
VVVSFQRAMESAVLTGRKMDTARRRTSLGRIQATAISDLDLSTMYVTQKRTLRPRAQ